MSSSPLDYLTEVTRGTYSGRKSLIVSGLNPDVDMTPVTEDMWNLTAEPLYTFPADGTAPIDTISSSDAGDTTQLTMIGSDINGVETTQFVTLDGQNKVRLGTALWRHNLTINKSASDLLGDVYTYEDTTITAGVPDDLGFVRGYVAQGDNRSFQGINTIPANKLGYLYWMYPFLSSEQNANVAIQLFTREFGGVMISSTPVGLNSNGTSFLPVRFPVPIQLQPRTDIIPRIIGSSDNNVGVGINYSLILIDQ